MTVDVKWDIRREGRAWSGDEAMQRYNLTPEEFEMYRGKLMTVRSRESRSRSLSAFASADG